MHTSAQLGHVRTRALENQTEESVRAFFLLTPITPPIL